MSSFTGFSSGEDTLQGGLLVPNILGSLRLLFTLFLMSSLLFLIDYWDCIILFFFRDNIGRGKAFNDRALNLIEGLGERGRGSGEWGWGWVGMGPPRDLEGKRINLIHQMIVDLNDDTSTLRRCTKIILTSYCSALGFPEHPFRSLPNSPSGNIPKIGEAPRSERKFWKHFIYLLTKWSV